MTVESFAARVRDYCSILRGSVTSWGRTESRNAMVGGVPNSRHLLFLAVDVVYDHPVTVEQAIDLAGSFGLRVIREGDHDHIQPR